MIWLAPCCKCKGNCRPDGSTTAAYQVVALLVRSIHRDLIYGEFMSHIQKQAFLCPYQYIEFNPVQLNLLVNRVVKGSFRGLKERDPLEHVEHRKAHVLGHHKVTVGAFDCFVTSARAFQSTSAPLRSIYSPACHAHINSNAM